MSEATKMPVLQRGSRSSMMPTRWPTGMFTTIGASACREAIHVAKGTSEARSPLALLLPIRAACQSVLAWPLHRALAIAMAQVPISPCPQLLVWALHRALASTMAQLTINTCSQFPKLIP